MSNFTSKAFANIRLLGFVFIGLLCADSLYAAEVQWTVCADSHFRILKLIQGNKHVDVESWETTLYDDENLTLFMKHNLVLRERAGESSYETALKINLSVDEYEKLDKQGELRDFKCELDSYEGRSKMGCAAKNKSYSSKDKFSDRQKKLLKKFAAVPFSHLRKFGPVPTRSFEFDLFKSFQDYVTVEVMKINSRSLWVEVSTRTDDDDIARVNKKMLEWFSQNNIYLCQPRVSKTETILTQYR